MRAVDVVFAMGERGGMQAALTSLVALVVLAFSGAFVAAAPEARIVLAQAAPPERLARPNPQTRAQAGPRPPAAARHRARITVYPRYPYRRYHSLYPLPYPIEFPGPHAVRHCVNQYVIERRPSGDVLVPRMRCWWAPG
jgi:hypothetical protein